jgi:MFS family permease
VSAPGRLTPRLPIVLLATAQFVMVLDTTVMNVSISQVVADLDTTVDDLQLAITLFALVMAAFMLTGGRLGGIWGSRRAFSVGLVVYGTGSLVTALSPNLATLLLGWSLLEGLGAALVIPTIFTLTALTYTGSARALAYGVLGAVAGSAAALGPLIGGWVTTELSWRLVFIGEVVLVIGILAVVPRLPSGRPEVRPRFDLVGAGLSVGGMGLLVYGVLQSQRWGWVEPKAPPVIGGHEVAPLGLAPTLFVVAAGLALLAGLLAWSRRLETRDADPLLKPSLLTIESLRAGLGSIAAQQLLIAGLLFAIPLYLQIVQGKDALETGVRVLPLSLGLVVSALVASSVLSRRFSARRLVQAGLLVMIGGTLTLVGTVDLTLDDARFAAGMALFGVGAGLMASQLSNVNMSAVPESETDQAGGLQGTFQYLGSSLGTALIGSVLLAGLTGAFLEKVVAAGLPEPVTTRVEQAAVQGIAFVPSVEVEAIAREAGLPDDQVAAVTASYADAQIEALRRALAAAAFLAILALWFTRNLPRTPMTARPPPEDRGRAEDVLRAGR